MPTGTKLSNSNLAISLVSFIGGTIGLFLIILLIIFLDKGSGGFVPYITETSQALITVSVAFAVLSAILYCYFLFENKYVLSHFSKMAELFLVMFISFFLVYVMSEYVHTLARPVALLALVCATLFRRRDAIFINSVYSLMVLIFDRILNINGINMFYSYACLLSKFCTGIVAVFLFNSVKTRFQSVMMAFILLIPVLVINTVIILPVTSPSASEILDLLIFSGVGCIFSVMLYMFVLPIFELVFAEMTVFRLRELTSDSAKLIKKLKEKAPGTYSHSVVVSQLAEACAKAIGEDSELARAAAYYHDVGKLVKPEMFTENQSDYNVHNELSPELSADIIRSHTRDGAKLIKKQHLPEFLSDIAIQHHGTLPIKYFYAKALKMTDGEISMANYSYTGPVPQTRIAAIIMIVDAAEAATRSLANRTPANIEKLVGSLIEERINLDQFVDCNITMRDLTIITHTIAQSLSGVYHSRISYPKIKIGKKN